MCVWMDFMSVKVLQLHVSIDRLKNIYSVASTHTRKRKKIYSNCEWWMRHFNLIEFLNIHNFFCYRICFVLFFFKFSLFLRFWCFFTISNHCCQFSVYQNPLPVIVIIHTAILYSGLSSVSSCYSCILYRVCLTIP